MEEMVSFHWGLGSRGAWTESVAVVKPGASEEEVAQAADTAKALAFQFVDEVAAATEAQRSLAGEFVKRLTPRQILDLMDVEFAGMCEMPIGDFGGKNASGIVAEVYQDLPEAVKWVGTTKAKTLLEGATPDRILGIVACGKYWAAMEKLVREAEKEEEPKKEEKKAEIPCPHPVHELEERGPGKEPDTGPVEVPYEF